MSASETKKENGRLSETGDKLSGDFESLKANFSELRSDVTRILGHLADAGKSGKQMAKGQANWAVERAGEKAHDAMDTIRDRAQDAKEYGQDSLEQLTRQIRANPGAATAIAFGVGFIASRLLLRRS